MVLRTERHKTGKVIEILNESGRLRLWKVIGTLKGISYTYKIRAIDHNEAVKKASHAPYMVCVKSCVLIDE